jgi:hypothetical protein
LDGKGVAAVGIEHNATGMFETRIRHQCNKFIDFRIAGTCKCTLFFYSSVSLLLRDDLVDV